MTPEIKAQIIAAAVAALIQWAPWIAAALLAALAPLATAAFAWLRSHTKNATITHIYDVLERAVNAAMGAAVDRVESIKSNKDLTPEQKILSLKAVKVDVVDAAMAQITPSLPSWLTPEMISKIRAYAENLVERLLPLVKRDFSNGNSDAASK